MFSSKGFYNTTIAEVAKNIGMSVGNIYNYFPSKSSLANREMFCDEEDCGFKLAKDFVDEIERLINDGVKSGEFAKQNFYIAFSSLTGILGGITFLNGEKVLDAELRTYGKDLSRTIYKALS
jgi:hypothetical protein